MQLKSTNVKYGQLLDWAPREGVISTSVKVHFFNKKGVLIGRYYRFVPYVQLKVHNGVEVYERRRLRKPFGRLKQMLYETTCKVVTILLRHTQG